MTRINSVIWGIYLIETYKIQIKRRIKLLKLVNKISTLVVYIYILLIKVVALYVYLIIKYLNCKYRKNKI